MLFSDAFADTAPAPKSDATLIVDNSEQAPYELSPQKMLSDTGVFLLFLFAIFYFLLIRPQQKRYKSHKLMLENVQKGARVVTGGGIIGTVTKLESKDIVLVEIAQGIRVRVARDSISEVLPEGSPHAETANDN